MKSIRILSFSGLNFLAFELNTEICRVNLCIQFKYGKIRTRKSLNTDPFYAAKIQIKDRLNLYFTNQRDKNILLLKEWF